MSGGILFREALRTLNRLELPAETTRDLVAALEAGRKQNPLPLLYEAGSEAGLDRDALHARGAALYIGWCAGNLCDDLVDGDCDWLELPRLGPAAQLILHHVFFQKLLEGGLPPDAVSEALGHMVQAAAWAHVELRTTRWTPARYRQMAEMQGGRQWVSWMKLLWWGTPLEPHAESFARHAAIATFVAEDRRSADPRFTSLPDDARAELLAWARAELDALDRLGLRVCGYVRAGVMRHLGLGEGDGTDAG